MAAPLEFTKFRAAMDKARILPPHMQKFTGPEGGPTCEIDVSLAGLGAQKHPNWDHQKACSFHKKRTFCLSRHALNDRQQKEEHTLVHEHILAKQSNVCLHEPQECSHFSCHASKWRDSCGSSKVHQGNVAEGLASCAERTLNNRTG